MRERLIENIQPSETIDQVGDAVLRTFEEVKKETGSDKIFYVSGIITSEGPEHIERNMKVLAEHTARIREDNGAPVFSATDVFNDQIFEQISAQDIPVQGWLDFWRRILGSGYVTDIVMTPRWEKSTGARDEYEAAKELGLNIHIMEDLSSDNTE